jgi:DNA-binding NarL/FixJ family response regulator
MCKILIVDDSPVIRSLIRSSVETNSDWVVCGEAENGRIAVTMVETLRPHLVILDLSMPVMNGLDAAREISAIAPSTPMIMFTMHESESLRKDAQRAGIKHVFPKEKGFGGPVLEAIKTLLPAA